MIFFYPGILSGEFFVTVTYHYSICERADPEMSESGNTNAHSDHALTGRAMSPK